MTTSWVSWCHLLGVNPEARGWGIREEAGMGGCPQWHEDPLLKGEEKRSLSVSLFVHSLPSLKT